LVSGELPRESEVSLKSWSEKAGEGARYTDGSRMSGVTAAVSAEHGIYLGDLATMMDAEILWIAVAWEEWYRTVASDSQAAIQKCLNLTSGTQGVRSWIGEKVLKAAKGGTTRELMWVKGRHFWQLKSIIFS